VRLLRFCAVLVGLSAFWGPYPSFAQTSGTASGSTSSPTTSSATATASGITAELHPWGHFSKGAWRYTRVVTECFDEHGVITSTSVTEAKTTLQEVGPDGVTLQIMAAVEVAGKQRDADPQTVKQCFSGEPACDKPAVRDMGAAELTIDGCRVPCRIEQVESSGSHCKTSTKIYYSSSVAPYVLKRESTTTDSESGEVLTQSTTKVLSLDSPCDIPRRRKQAAQVETTSTHPKGGSTVTRAMTSTEIPGGVLCHTTDERDAAGHLVRRSTLQLMAYGADDREEYSVEFKRTPRRANKASRF
jgi:hypothetical protein